MLSLALRYREKQRVGKEQEGPLNKRKEKPEKEQIPLPGRFRLPVTMAYVSIPKDLGKVKNKLILNMTRRQIICLAAAAVVGLPFYFITKDYIGISNAATGMVMLMLPAFFFAMYEKDGMPLEKVLMNVISVKLIRPAIRRYEVENLYEEGDGYIFLKPGRGDISSTPGKGGRVSAGREKK